MKNLKKVLALVLVVASLMGLATMASATTSDDYSDADSITHVEAVDVMSTIGVFDGISGAFSGDSILTREQAAKIITYMILGKDDADALVASVAPYTDVSRDRWSAGSIAYCKNEGILAGVGNGRFEPDGKLTGVAFAKMCLVALGYDPDVQELTGSQWAVNTSKLAIADAGITGDLSQISLADEMSREDACQMAFNTLQADMVDYDDRGSVIVAGDVTISNKPSKAKPVSFATGWADVEGKKNDGNIENDGIQQFAEKYFTKLTKEDTTDSFGRPATYWKYKADEIGTYIDNSQLVQSWTAKAPKSEMYNAIGSSIIDKLNDSKQDEDEYKFWLFVNDDEYVVGPDARVATYKKDDFFVKNSSAAAGKEYDKVNEPGFGMSGNGVLTELYMDDKDNVTVVMINTFLVQATADYNTTNERVNIAAVDGVTTANLYLPAYIDNDDFDVTGVKEDDYLLVTLSDIGSGTTTIESVTPATIQTGTVTEFAQDKDEKADNVTMDGTKYSFNKIVSGSTKNDTFSLDSNATLVLDSYGYIMYVDEAVSSKDFVYIDRFVNKNNTSRTAVGIAYFTDGTTEDIDIHEAEGLRTFSGITGLEGRKWYTFTKRSDNKYNLTLPSESKYYDRNSVYVTGNDVTFTGTKIAESGKVKYLSAVSGISANNDTIIVVRDKNNDVTAYQGIANAPDITIGSGKGDKVRVAYLNKNSGTKDSPRAGSTAYIFVDVSEAEGRTTGSANAADYIFVMKKGSRSTRNGERYFECDVIVDGKQDVRWISDAVSFNTGDLLQDVKEDSNGYITDANAFDGTDEDRVYIDMSSDDYEISHDSGVLTISNSGGTERFTANSKSEIHLIYDKDAEELITDGDDFEPYPNVALSTVGGNLKGYKNLGGKVYAVLDSDGSNLVKQLWIWVNNAVVKQ